MINKLLQQECDLKFFHTHGYVRRQCTKCKSYFWTLNPEDTLCGDRPCVEFSFIGKPLTDKPLTLNQVRSLFLQFFQKKNHGKVSYPLTGDRCPVIARWRTDIYLTIASIADFQPHVTSGEVPPPSNPLVISQPCIRLNDLDEVGKSGRHLTMFEMMGHHAFNKNQDEIYWKEETVAFCDEFFTKIIGIPQKLITYKEELWIGGGNAGPCIEVLAGGLEIATLVFMNLQEDNSGDITLNEVSYSQNPLNIVDTGYGLERITWVTQGTPTVYETVFPEILPWLSKNIKQKIDPQRLYALADHTKCLAFMLGDGIVPSNVKAGYLARLMIRRCLRFLEELDVDLFLPDLVHRQLETLKQEFPSLMTHPAVIDDMLQVETKRFQETITKGKHLVSRIIQEKKTLGDEDLITLYDTHGMPPDMVQRIAKSKGVEVKIPDHFESMVAELHSHEKKQESTDEIIRTLPATQPLYYSDHYLKETHATVLWAQTHKKGSEVVVDQTVCYPEGGGQPGDSGTMEVHGKQYPIISVTKEGQAIVHIVQGPVQKGEKVKIKIDWDHRYTLMKHHTGTHVVNGALQQLFGKHIWQAGSQLGLNEARFDFSHYKPITEKEKQEIERLANISIKKGVPVEKKSMERNAAEKAYGFRLYQGGVPPGNMIRVLNIPGVDVEACGGTHLNNIKEIEKIRIVKTERIQDGVNRVIFAAGGMVDAYKKEELQRYNSLVTCLQEHYLIPATDDVTSELRQVAQLFSVPEQQVEKTLQRFLKEAKLKKKVKASSLHDACQHLFTAWKETQKQKKQVSSDEIDALKAAAESIPGTTVKVITGTTSTEGTTLAGSLVAEPDYVVHLFDGKKIVSAASENLDIDLRTIVPVLGKLLGGSGGGKPKMAQSGGPDHSNIDKVLAEAKRLTKKALSK